MRGAPTAPAKRRIPTATVRRYAGRMDAVNAALPTIETEMQADGRAVARLAGDWTLLPLHGRFEELGQVLAGLTSPAGEPGAKLWDLRGLRRLDNAGALVLWQAWGRRRPERLELLPE